MDRFRHAGLLLVLFVALFPAAGLAKAKPKAKQPGVKRHHMTLRHVNTKEEVKDLWVIRTDPKNKNKQWVGENARKKLTHFFRDWKHGKTKHVPERLVWYLYLVQQRFDAPIEIVSGYRSKERKSSKHAHGHAIDFRVVGVDPKEVWEYCKRFDRVGLGWYPTSQFVHMDVRDESAYWIDDSGPGEDAQYRAGVSQKRPFDKRKARASKRGKDEHHAERASRKTSRKTSADRSRSGSESAKKGDAKAAKKGDAKAAKKGDAKAAKKGDAKAAKKGAKEQAKADKPGKKVASR